MGRDDTIPQVVAKLYSAVLEPDGWNDVLLQLNQLTGSQDAGLLILRSGTAAPGYIAGNFDAAHDARMRAVAAAGAMPVWRESLSLGDPKRRSAMQPDREFVQTVFYNEIVRPRGMFHGIMAALLRSPELGAYLSIGRSLGYEDFDADEMFAVQALVPHFITAMQIQDRLGTADLSSASGYAVLDKLDVGIILVDERMKPIMVNASANSILARRDGLSIQGDGITAASPDETQALRRALATAIVLSSPSPGLDSVIKQGAIGRMQISRPSLRLPLRVRVMPMHAVIDWPGVFPRAGLFVTEPDPLRDAGALAKSLQTRFRLTPAEAAFAAEIMKGDGQKAAAERRGISIGTARTHLSRIFAKTGARRQAELVRLLLESGDVGDK